MKHTVCISSILAVRLASCIETCIETCGDKTTPGFYTIAGVPNVYCDNGMALIQNTVSEFCPLVEPTVDAEGRYIPGYGALNSVTTNSCGYFTNIVVQKLAKFADAIMLEDATRGKLTSTNMAAIEALSNGGNWHNGATWSGTDGWDFTVPSDCQSVRATGWPNIFDCCDAGCMHWLSPRYGYMHSMAGKKPPVGSQTWLVMKTGNTGEQQTTPTTGNTEQQPTQQRACLEENTCAGRKEGFHLVAGHKIYCRDGYALLQSGVSSCRLTQKISFDEKEDVPSYGALFTVTMNSCGYLTANAVSELAQHATAVRLIDEGRGMAESSDAKALSALVNKENWHNGAQWTSAEGWRFDDAGCDHDHASHWPNMFNGCACDDCVRWLTPAYGFMHSRDLTKPPQGSQTWLKMCEYWDPTSEPTTEPTQLPTAVPTLTPTAEPTFEPTMVPTSMPTVEPTPEPTPLPCSVTWYAKQAGLHTIAGVENVYCNDRGEALLQYSNTQLCPIGRDITRPYPFNAESLNGYSQAPKVTPENCGFMSSAHVQQLAQFATGVRLVDEGRGEAVSTNSLAVEALLNGGTWHNGASFRVSDPSWCFTTDCDTKIQGWPNMYHSCGNEDCVHWTVSSTHSKNDLRPALASMTWLAMISLGTDCPVVSVPASVATSEPARVSTPQPTEVPQTPVPSSPPTSSPASTSAPILETSAAPTLAPTTGPTESPQPTASITNPTSTPQTLSPTMSEFNAADTNGDGIVRCEELWAYFGHDGLDCSGPLTPSTFEEALKRFRKVDPEDTCFGRSAGVFTVAGIANVYCNERGEALIQHSKLNACQNLSQYTIADSLTPKVCGYLSPEAVQKLAQFSFGVRLIDDGRGEAASTDGLAVQALLTGGTWHNGAAFAASDPSWCFTQSCPKPDGWPNMYHSCENPNCVHWIASSTHSKSESRPLESFTWLKMNPTNRKVDDSTPKNPPMDVLPNRAVDANSTESGGNLFSVISNCRIIGLSCLHFILIVGGSVLVCCFLVCCCCGYCWYRRSKKEKRQMETSHSSQLGHHRAKMFNRLATSTVSSNPLSGAVTIARGSERAGFTEPHTTVASFTSSGRSHHTLRQAW